MAHFQDLNCVTTKDRYLTRGRSHSWSLRGVCPHFMAYRHAQDQSSEVVTTRPLASKAFLNLGETSQCCALINSGKKHTYNVEPLMCLGMGIVHSHVHTYRHRNHTCQCVCTAIDTLYVLPVWVHVKSERAVQPVLKIGHWASLVYVGLAT